MVIFEKVPKNVSTAHLQAFARQAQRLARVKGDVSVLITGSSRMHQLNRQFRRKDKPTDVLSFPGESGGDIAISVEIAAENAVRYGHGLEDELKVLVLHGLLHLAGHDHEQDNGEMASVEAKLRARLGLRGSLIERTGKAAKNGGVSKPRRPSSRDKAQSRSGR